MLWILYRDRGDATGIYSFDDVPHITRSKIDDTPTAIKAPPSLPHHRDRLAAVSAM